MREYIIAISAYRGTDIWDFVDGTVVKIYRPIDNQRLCYLGHKKKYCLKFQAIIIPNGLISSLCGPIMGRHGDWYIFQTTDVEEEIFDLWRREGVEQDGRLFLYSDPAYYSSDTVIRAYKRPRGGALSPNKALVNPILSASCIAVKYSFRIVQRTFKKSNFSDTPRINSFLIAVYYSTVVLLINVQMCL